MVVNFVHPLRVPRPFSRGCARGAGRWVENLNHGRAATRAKGIENSCYFADPGRGEEKEIEKGSKSLSTALPLPERFRDGGNARPILRHKVGGGRSARHTPLARSAICVRRLDDSRNSAIRLKYRDSLRFSSLREPRYPSMRVVFFLFGGCKSAFYILLPGCFDLRGRKGPPERRVHCQ